MNTPQILNEGVWDRGLEVRPRWQDGKLTAAAVHAVGVAHVEGGNALTESVRGEVNVDGALDVSLGELLRGAHVNDDVGSRQSVHSRFDPSQHELMAIMCSF